MNESVDGALKLAAAAIRGLLARALLRLLRKMVPDDGAVAAVVEEAPTAPIRPPISRASPARRRARRP